MDEWRQGIRAAEQQIEEERPKQLAAADKAARDKEYGLRDAVYFRCVKRHGKEGERLFSVRATAIAGLPVASMEVWANGEAITVTEAAEIALHEARFRYAEALWNAKAEKTWEAAKLRAAKAEIIMADLVT